MKVVYLVPNYNGERIIGSCLSRIDGSIFVVDDASTDASIETISTTFPSIKMLSRKYNGGFSAAVNDGIRTTDSDFIVLLNNDVEVTEGFLDSMLPLFDDETVFAVSPKILLPKYDNLDEGCKTGFWRHGMFYTDQRQGVSEVTPILYTTGCAAIYRRSMLDKLGGFDEAYSPFYWEDTDLGYRAWKRGWKSLYQPASVVYHQHSASISQMNRDYTARIRARNSLFFIWRNIEDQDMLAAHRHWLPFVIAKQIAIRNMSFIRGWCDAYSRRRDMFIARNYDSEYRVLSDRDIFAECGVDIK